MFHSRKRVTAALLTVLTGAMLLSGCTPSDGRTVAKIGDEKVTYGEANFMVRYMQSMYEAYYKAYGSDMETVWSGDSGSDDGTTMEDSVKNTVKDQIEEYYLLRQNMDKYDVSLSEDDEKAISDAADTFIKANSDEAIEAMNATTENVKNYLELITIQKRMQEKIEAEVDTEVSYEDAQMKDISYVEFTYDATVENADSASSAVADIIDSMSTQTSASAKEQADAFAAGVATAEDFSAYAEEQGYTATDATIDADSESPSAAVVEAVWNLANGETSAVIEDTDNSAYYVVRMTNADDQEATESNKATVLAERQQDAYDQKIEDWKDDTTIKWYKKVWKKISLSDVGVAMVIPGEDSTDDTTEETTSLSTDTSLTVQDGDTVNIDYVGTVDGVEFEGGNTQGTGTDLTIGSGSYIDDFEDQLVGAHPGDTVTVEVTFPEDYGEETLNGKDAVFTVTINGIYQ